MHSLGRFLQLLGLIIVPMGLIYYFDHERRTGESHLAGELLFLALGVAIFLLGGVLARRR